MGKVPFFTLQAKYHLVACLFVILIASIFLAQHFIYMGTTPLWTDEIASVMLFSQKGPLYSWLNYPVANNHVLFNILASAVPEKYAYHPFAARLLSIFSVAAAIAALASFALYRRSYVVGSLLILLITINPFSLPLILQARGYSLLFLSAVMIFVSAFVYFKNNNIWFVVIFAVFSLIGGATVPLFAVFSAIAAIALIIITLRLRVILILVVTGVVGFIFYLPLMRQIFEEAINYGDEWGRFFSDISVIRAVIRYLLPREPGFLFYSSSVFLTLVACAYAFSVRDFAYRKFFIFTLACVTGFFIFVFWLQTPLLRTTQFIIAGPIVLLLATADMNGSSRMLRHAVIGVSIFLSLQVALIGIERSIKGSVPPLEVWGDVAKTIVAISEPGTPIYAPFRSNYLSPYTKDRNPIITAFDENEYTNGDLIVVDSDFTSKNRFSGTSLVRNAVDIRIAQQRGGFQVVSFVAKTPRVRLEAELGKGRKLSTLKEIRSCGDPKEIEKWRLTLLDQCQNLYVLLADKARAYEISMAAPFDHDKVRRIDRLLKIDISGRSSNSVELKRKWWASPQCQPIRKIWCDLL